MALKWARGLGCNSGPPTNKRAAQTWHMALLQWALENGCGWD
jgi:hypothetical protein